MTIYRVVPLSADGREGPPVLRHGQRLATVTARGLIEFPPPGPGMAGLARIERVSIEELAAMVDAGLTVPVAARGAVEVHKETQRVKARRQRQCAAKRDEAEERKVAEKEAARAAREEAMRAAREAKKKARTAAKAAATKAAKKAGKDMTATAALPAIISANSAPDEDLDESPWDGDTAPW